MSRTRGKPRAPGTPRKSDNLSGVTQLASKMKHIITLFFHFLNHIFYIFIFPCACAIGS